MMVPMPVIMLMVMMLVVVVMMFVLMVMMFVLMVMMLMLVVMMFVLMVVMLVFVVMLLVFMIMMLVLMVVDIMGFFLQAVHGYLHMGSGNTAFHGRFSLHMNPGQPQPIHLFDENLPVFRQLQQSRGQHIARRSHAALQIQCLHFVSPFC